MISDELREILSAYVDGELPHGEAARVEESAKRDPRLRRHINAYRRLGDTLRVWDVEERTIDAHGHLPSDRLKERALARVRSYESERRHEHTAAPAVWWQQPVAMAAGLLIALGLGVFIAAQGGREQSSVAVARADSLNWKTIDPYADYTASLKVESFDPFGAVSAHWPDDVLRSVVLFETVGIPVTIDGEIVYARNHRTVAALNHIRNFKRDLRRSPAKPDFGETRTGTRPNAFLASMLKDYDVQRTSIEGLVALRHPAVTEPIPAMRPAPARTDDASSYVQAGEVGTADFVQHYIQVTRQNPVLTLLGEVWVEPVGGRKSDRVGRSRLVTATTWVKTGELVKMAWASETAADPKAKQFALCAESLVLGPNARRQLLLKNGRDDALLAALTEAYGSKGTVAAGRASAAKHKATVQRLVSALAADRHATGFVVYGENGRMLGTEIFATHELMAQFAPRLLRGYLLEAGGSIRLKAANGRGEKQMAQVRAFLAHELPRAAERVVDVRTWKDAEDWPQGMRQVNLVSPTRQIVGHGLFLGNTPIHLTLFGG